MAEVANAEETGMVVASGEIVPATTILQMAGELKRKMSPVQVKKEEWKEEDFVTACLTCLSYGMLPFQLGYEFFLWKDYAGVHFHRKYASYLNWAMEKEPYRAVYQELSPDQKPGLGKGDIATRCYIVRRSEESLYQERYRVILSALTAGGMTASEAIDLADEKAIGIFPWHESVVKKSEVYDNNGKLRRGGGGEIKGWIPGETRGQIRALVGVIKKVYGEPSPAETRGRNLGKYGPDISPAMAANISVGMPEEMTIEPGYIQEKYAQLTAQNELLLQEIVKRDEGKNGDVLRQERQERIADSQVLHNPEPGEDWISEDWREVVWTAEDDGDDDSISISEFREALISCGYSDERAQNYAIGEIFGKTIDGLSLVEMHNMIEYGKRRIVLNNKDIDIAARVAMVPELKNYKGKVVLPEIGKSLQALVVAMSKHNEKLGTLLFGVQDE